MSDACEIMTKRKHGWLWQALDLGDFYNTTPKRVQLLRISTLAVVPDYMKINAHASSGVLHVLNISLKLNNIRHLTFNVKTYYSLGRFLNNIHIPRDERFV